MELWLKAYKEKGLEGILIGEKVKQKRTRCITQDIHDDLSERLNDPKKGFNSYIDALHWVQKNYDSNVKYQGLRNYMIEFFGTKILSPRKSHINKSPEAKADFLKLT